MSPFSSLSLLRQWTLNLCVVQVPQEQLEGVLRCAGQLRIRGLDSDYGRHQVQL